MRRGITVLAVTVVVVTVLLLISARHSLIPFTSVEDLRETLLSYGPWAILVSASLMILQAIIAPIPGNVIVVANGLVFGPIWGGLLSWTTNLIAASLCFGLSKTFGKPFAARVVGQSLENAERFFRKYGMHAVFVVRIMPFVPFDGVSYAAGVVGVPYSRFLLATAIGIIPSTLVYSYIGPIVLYTVWWALPLGLCMTAIMAAIISRMFAKLPVPVVAPVETERSSGD